MSLDTKVKNLIINTNMTKEQYEAVDDKSNQLFFVEDSSVVDVPAPEENQSGYLHTDGVNLTWKEIEVDNFLPLSGGTIDGELAIKSSGSSSTVEPLLTLSYGSSDVVIKKVRYGKELDFDNTKISGLAGVVPTQSTGQLGASGAFWSKAYIRNLNAGAPNGKDLLVPSKAGTLATLEDIPEDTQLETLPTASADNLNKIYQYVGETTPNYINGYFYKCINNIIQNWFTAGYAQYDTSLTLIITVDQEKFLAQNPVWQDMGEDTKVWRADYDESTSEWYVWTQQPNIYISNADLKEVWGIDVTNAAGDYVPANGDTLLIQLSETEEFMWGQVNVQPTPEVDILPDQTDNAGKFLMTDGTTASWSDKPLVNNADNESSNPYAKLSIGGNSNLSTAAWYTAVGNGAYVSSDGGIAIGGTWEEKGLYAAHAGGPSSISIGYDCEAVGSDSIAIGEAAYANENQSIAIGAYAEATAINAIAIGGYSGGAARAKATAECAIQLGCGTDSGQDCTNSDANTFKVANQNGNFELMDADGNVPLDRLTYVTNQIGDISTALTAILGE